MKASLLALLEEAIDVCVETIVEHCDYPTGAYWATNQTQNMARAAAAVFDASVDGQQFLRDEEIE